MFTNRWWRCVRSAVYSGCRYLSRLAKTNDVSTIGIASTTSGKNRATVAAVFRRPWIDTAASTNPSNIAPESPMKIRAG